MHLPWAAVYNRGLSGECILVPRWSENFGLLKNPAMWCGYGFTLVPGVGYRAASDYAQMLGEV